MNNPISNFLTMLFWGIVFIAVVCLILGLPVWILWNLLVPSLFGLPPIGFWEAVGLNVLCSLLFKDNTSLSKVNKGDKNDTD